MILRRKLIRLIVPKAMKKDIETYCIDNELSMEAWVDHLMVTFLDDVTPAFMRQLHQLYCRAENRRALCFRLRQTDYEELKKELKRQGDNKLNLNTTKQILMTMIYRFCRLQGWGPYVACGKTEAQVVPFPLKNKGIIS